MTTGRGGGGRFADERTIGALALAGLPDLGGRLVVRLKEAARTDL